MRNKLVIGVIGASSCDEFLGSVAEKTGRLIAENGWILITGGMGGVMEYASKGAKSKNGLVVGIIPSDKKDDGNPYMDIKIITGMNEARNQIIVLSADFLIAIGGGYGTLSEIAFGLKREKYIFGINTWEIEGVKKVNTPEEAIERIKELIK